jgi:hypothetical protein
LAASVVAALAMIGWPAVPAQAAGTDAGEYWLTFPRNYVDTPELTLFLSGSQATTGVVEISALAFSQPFSVTPGAITSVVIPPSAQISGTALQSALGIHVSADAPVTVYGLNRIQYTTDAYLGVPVSRLGTRYVAAAYDVNADTGLVSVVAAAEATTVTVTPSTALTDGRPAGVPFDVTLAKGDVYSMEAALDITGTLVTSDKPVSVFSGSACTNIPTGYSYCDHIVEQLAPTSSWGTKFLSMPLATRLNGDTFRVIADQPDTQVSVNGAVVATLAAGQFHEQIVAGPASITSDKPIQVMQYSNSSTYDGVTSDPFMMTVPPYEQYLNKYVVTTPASGFSGNYINVIAPTASVGSVTLDGSAIPASDFAVIAGTTFSGAQLPVSLGSHALAGPLPFGVHSYGYDEYDSYGYPGGMGGSPVATVQSLTVAPATETLNVGAEACTTATAKDGTSTPVADVRVDFAVTGANTVDGFAMTNASGVATYCYTGTNAGTDTVTASLSLLSGQVTKIWTAANQAPTAKAGGPYSGNEGSAIPVTGSGTDPEDAPLTYAWSVVGSTGTDAGASCTFADPAKASTTVTCTDDGTYTLRLTVSDGALTATSDAALTVLNASPTVAITSPTDMALVKVGAPVTLTAKSTDPGSNDGLTCTIDWGDGTTSAGTVASGTCSGTHTYASAGVFDVTVTVTDDDGASATDTISLVTYDQTTKVTGGGFVKTDAGRTSFGFVAKDSAGSYTGQLQVRLPGKSKFHAGTVTSLTVVGNTATWTGTGSLNKVEGYTYTVTVVDNGSGSGKKSTPDTIEITIKAPDNTVAASVKGPLQGGNLTVHK